MMVSKVPSDRILRSELSGAVRGVASRIRSERLARGKTQAQIAADAGLSTVTLSKIEIGKNVPSIETFVALADALNSSPNHLLGWLEKPQSLTKRQQAIRDLTDLCEQLPDDLIETLVALARKIPKS